MTSQPLDPPLGPGRFRALFPALASTSWLDTPGAPPGAQPVVDVLRNAVAAWASGDFDWREWDAATARARDRFARFVGVDPSTVSTHGSHAEAAATVEVSLPPGRIVVPAAEFRSNLFPWSVHHEVVAVPPRDGATRLEDLVAALDERVVLLAVSEVTSGEGQRLDLAALRAATDRVGARLFVDLTQSLGALRLDLAAANPDYLATHGYKWLLCPRGAAWLVTRPDRVPELRPLAPSWRSTEPPYGYFGPAELAPDAGRCDASPAWFSWLGADAALRLVGSLDPVRVEQHCLDLAGHLAAEARRLGLQRLTDGPASHIVVLRTDRADHLVERLREQRVRATALGDRVRFGVHYFNDERDVEAALRALAA